MNALDDDTKPSSDIHSLKLLYPDLVEYGSLCRLLQSHLNAIGSPLRMEDLDKTVDERTNCWAFVKSNARSSQPVIAALERLFLLDLWERGVHLASVKTPSPREAAQILDQWIAVNIPLRELCQQFPPIESDPCAGSYAAGPAEYIEWRWAQLHRSIAADRFLSVLAPVADLAHPHPKLGKLMPFTSLQSLCFSQCTGYPFIVPCPVIVPITHPDSLAAGVEPQYEVRGDGNRALAQGNAEVVIEFVATALPPNFEPAFHGTAEERVTGNTSLAT